LLGTSVVNRWAQNATQVHLAEVGDLGTDESGAAGNRCTAALDTR